MDGHGCHQGVETVIGERQRLRHRVDRANQMCGSLGAHRGGGLDRGHFAVGRLVTPSARANIQHRPRIAERAVDLRRNLGFRLAEARVAAAYLTIVDVARAAVGEACHPYRSSAIRA